MRSLIPKNSLTYSLENLLKITQFLTVQLLVAIRVQFRELPVQDGGIRHGLRTTRAHCLLAKNPHQITVECGTIRLAARPLSPTGSHLRATLGGGSYVRLEADLMQGQTSPLAVQPATRLAPAGSGGLVLLDGSAHAVGAPAVVGAHALNGSIVAILPAPGHKGVRITELLPASIL